MKKNFGKWISIIIFLVIGGICGIFIGQYMTRTIPEGAGVSAQLLAFVGLLLSFYFVIFFQILIHEAGHLLFGLMSGYRFLSFRIGSFMWVKREEKLRLYRYQLAGTGGQCLMAPPHLEQGEKKPYVLYNLGGSLINFGVALLCVLIAIGLPVPNLIELFLYEMAIVGVAFALMNGVPLRMGMVDNDGYNAISMGKNPETLEAFYLQLRVNEEYLLGKKLNDMPQEWFYMPKGEALNNTMIAGVGVYYCNRLMEAELFEEADATMEELMKQSAKMIGIHRQMLKMDQLYCELIGKCRIERIEALRDKELLSLMKSMKGNPSVLRTHFAYALIIEKDIKKVEKLQQQFEKMAAKYPYERSIESERALMEKVRERKEEGNGLNQRTAELQSLE